MVRYLPFRNKRLFINRKSRRKHFLLLLILISAVTILTIHLFNILLTNAVSEIAQAEAVNAATEIISSTVNDLISQENISYSGIVTLKYNEKGEIISADTNTILLNKLKSELSKAILEKFSDDERIKIQIPIGSLLKSELFSGRGPNINIKIKKAGEIKTDTSSTFTDAGINQTCHRISINVTLSFTILLPSQTKKISTTTSVPIAETIIVGTVPSAYITQIK